MLTLARPASRESERTMHQTFAGVVWPRPPWPGKRKGDSARQTGDRIHQDARHRESSLELPLANKTQPTVREVSEAQTRDLEAPKAEQHSEEHGDAAVSLIDNCGGEQLLRLEELKRFRNEARLARRSHGADRRVIDLEGRIVGPQSRAKAPA